MEKPKHRLHINLKRPPAQNYPGEWTGSRKGKGYEFWQLREYQKGDSISLIDWKASARTGKLFVREFIQETFYDLMLLCDISPSMFFGKKFAFMKDLAVSLAYCALKDNNACGLMLYSDKIHKYYAPNAQYSQYATICNAIHKGYKTRNVITSITPVFKYLDNVVPKSLAIFLSDFLIDFDQLKPGQSYAGNKGFHKHELAAVHILEDIEHGHKKGVDGITEVLDTETGKTVSLDFSNSMQYNRHMKNRLEQSKKHLSRAGIDSLVLKTTEPEVEKKINTFFAKRAKPVA